MSISSKELVDNLIVGNFTNFSVPIMKLLETIESGQEVQLNDNALNDPDQLSVAIFNYPILKDDLYKEFAEAAKRISSAKYAYYKKSAVFKENFLRLCTETFNKHHQSDISLSHFEQIQKVRSAQKVIKFIGELYLSEFFINSNVAYFLETLSKNTNSKVSEDCFVCLISIISNRIKHEVKQYKHNVHIAAIVKIITEYENDASKEKRIYNDLEIIEAVNKTIKNKALKGINSRKDTSKSEIVRQTRKIFETILSGNIPLSTIVQNAYDISIIFPESFENEMLQLCIDYMKKASESPEKSFNDKCLEICKFIGMIYNFEALSSDGIKGIINFLNKSNYSFLESLTNVIFNEVYDKIVDFNDDVLKQILPENFKKDQNIAQSEKLESNNIAILANNDETNKNEEEEIKMSANVSSSSSSSDITSLTPPNKGNSLTDIAQSYAVSYCTSSNGYCQSTEKFKEIILKLSSTNVPYILREISQIRLTNGEETIKEFCHQLIEHAIYKPTLVKIIAYISVKLPETIIPHFNIGLMKKHLKAQISIGVVGCSLKESNIFAQLIKELFNLNYYDRFDIVLSLDNLTENFYYDRTAITTLLQFIEEFKEILVGKKMSKNIKQKLVNISQKLSIKMSEENNDDIKENISNAIKILNFEVKYNNEAPESSQKDKNSKLNCDVTYQKTEIHNDNGNSSSIVLPPLHLPPPKMLIPPPFIVLMDPKVETTPLTNASHIHEISLSKLPKEKQQMISKTAVDIKSYDDSSNRQSGSTSSISMHEIELESDEFYDTASDVNAESLASNNAKNEVDCESAYSSLLIDNYSNKEESFKNIIRDKFLYDAESMELFILRFIKRGIKYRNSGFILFINLVQESLKDNDDVFTKFIMIMNQKFLQFIHDLRKSNQEISSSEKKRSLQLILMIGEFYNMGFMKDQIFIACLERLLNDIGGEHQITLFHLLIKVSMDRIIQNGITHVCKTFLDVLAKRLSYIDDQNVRNLISWEIFITLKILFYRYQKTQYECPVTFFKIFLSKLNEESFMEKLVDIKFNYTYKKEQLVDIVESFLLTAKSSYQSPIYVKIADELQSITAVDDNNFTFKTHMEFKLHDVIKKFLENIHNECNMIELFKISSFVGDLFCGNVASIYLVLCILEMLLEKEIENKKIVDCVKIFLQKVGYKIDFESVYILDKFFMFFTEVVKCDKGYRRIIYKDLIELREKKWVRDEGGKDLELIEEYFGQMTNLNFMQIAFLICKIFSKSLEVMEMFVKLFWKLILINPEYKMLYAKLCTAISSYNGTFKGIFMSFMKQRNEAFTMICREPTVPNDTINKLSTIMCFMGYLYVSDFCTDDDFGRWILPLFTKNLTLEQCNQLSSIIGTKIQESGNNESLKAFFALIEYLSSENLFSAINSVKTNLSELML